MFKRYFSFFMSVYQGRSLEHQKKASLFLTTNSIIIVLILVNALANELILSHDTVNAVAETILALIMISVLFLLRRGNLLMATNIGTGLLLAGLTALTLINNPKTPVVIMVQLAILLIPIIIYACMLGIRTFQVVLVTIYDLSAVTVYFLAAVSGGGHADVNAWSLYIIVLFSIGLTGVMSASILKTTKEIIGLAENESARNLQRLKSMSSILESSRGNLSIGQKLQDSAADTLKLSEKINRDLNRMVSEMKSFRTAFQRASDVTQGVKLNAQSVMEVSSSQNSAVNETSSSVEEMHRSMQSILTAARQKKDRVRLLKETTLAGQKEMDESMAAVRELARSSEAILQMIQMIQDVASQTNILAMNASIEAAHAGSGGKGFAIVASEIRKLSTETDKNTKNIVETLKKNREGIQKTLRISDNVGSTFMKIRTDVDEVSGLINEIITGMEEMSHGVNQIRDAMHGVLEGSERVNASMNDVLTKMEENSSNMKEIDHLSARMEENVGTVVNYSGTITELSRGVETMGRENIAQIGQIESGLNSIKDKGGL